MRFSIFDSAKARKGRLCTYEEYLTYADSDRVRRLCAAISHEEDHDRRSKLKSQLPVITWQAEFTGRRLNAEAKPSGLFMLDIDHVDNPTKMYNDHFCGRDFKALHGIVFVGITASGHGLRVIARCRPEFKTIDECQQWLAGVLGVEHDGACKDWARCSYLVSSELTLFMDAKAIWEEEPEEVTLYDIHEPLSRNIAMEKLLPGTDSSLPQTVNSDGENSVFPDNTASTTGVDQREGLFGVQNEYHGIPLDRIAREWLEYTGGVPHEGDRNQRIFKLSIRMRYLTDFNEATMLRVIPSCGLGDAEMKSLIHSACTTSRGSNIPKDMKEVIARIAKRQALVGDEEVDEEIITDTSKLPPLPPIIRQWADTAPDDFKQSVVLCQLPILGALGSKLRARYLDGQIHTPTFQVSLEAPQASGKSFMMRLVNDELAQIIEHDEAQRAKEREYDNKVREMKLLNVKITPENKDEILGSRPKSLIRIVPPTISITKLLMRMNDAQGLHLFCFCPEADTMTKAFKRGFSSFSDLLRLSFDNEKAGQDYASDSSFSGVVNMYYNLLLSGTPKAMRRFYPDVEDGLISRVCFVTLPDQFGRPMPVWGTMSDKERQIVDVALVRLNEISLQGDVVQPDHMMKLDWLNTAIKQWILRQQSEAVRTDDRTRDIFCRRSAVVGFRAGMLAWFLYGEKNTPTIRKNVMRFSEWVSNCMLNQHLLRFKVNGTDSNVNKWEEAYNMLGDEFTREEVKKALQTTGSESPVRITLYQWQLLGIIEPIEQGREMKRGQKLNVKFKKIKR